MFGPWAHGGNQAVERDAFHVKNVSPIQQHRGGHLPITHDVRNQQTLAHFRWIDRRDIAADDHAGNPLRTVRLTLTVASAWRSASSTNVSTVLPYAAASSMAC
jgi:hypothetical protein